VTEVPTSHPPMTQDAWLAPADVRNMIADIVLGPLGNNPTIERKALAWDLMEGLNQLVESRGTAPPPKDIQG